MMSGINSVNIQPVQKNVSIAPRPHALIDDRSIKGILFLGVKGDISSIVESKTKIDIYI